ncbi:MAG TPA: anti-sigma factor [Gemmatimonadales bacterium]|nr:anti-sigma factor [Gemmatimonadales bacterium]
MRAHDWFIEHRIEYATRLLDAEEEAALREHLPRCEECRAEVQRIEDELRHLSMGVTPVPLRPGLNRRMVEYAVGADRRRPGPAWLVSAAAACLAFAVTGWTLGASHARPAVTDRVQARELAAIEDTMSIMRTAGKVLQEKLTMDGKEGGVVIFADSRTHRWNVVLHDLPPAPEGMRYTFWFITAEEGMVRDKDVPFDAVKPAMFTTSMPATGKVVGGALTLEPSTSVTGPPQGKHLVHLML